MARAAAPMFSGFRGLASTNRQFKLGDFINTNFIRSVVGAHGHAPLRFSKGAMPSVVSVASVLLIPIFFARHEDFSADRRGERRSPQGRTPFGPTCLVAAPPRCGASFLHGLRRR